MQPILDGLKPVKCRESKPSKESKTMTAYQTYYIINGIKKCGPFCPDMTKEEALKECLKKSPIGAKNITAERAM